MKINEDLKKLIQPLSIEEKEILTQSIKHEGCRDALVVWDDTLIDGHNRYEICTAFDIPFNTINKEFENIEEAKQWMINNQLGRRNLTDGWKYELIQVKKALLMEKGKEKISNIQKQRHNNVSLSTIDKDTNHNSRNELSKDLSWSTGKVAMADKVWAQATPEVKEQIKAGETTFNQAYNAIKKQDRKIEIEKQKEDIRQGRIELPIGVFENIVIDPPWSYGREYDPDGSRVANPYPEMNQESLKEIQIPSSNDSILWLWTTHAFMLDARELLNTWGFTYKGMIVWDKDSMGMGSWLRMQCEFCLLGIKGKPIWDVHNIRDIVRESRREHSRKPESFYQMIEDNFIGRKLDYFSRSVRDGWEVMGNDIKKF